MTNSSKLKLNWFLTVGIILVIVSAGLTYYFKSTHPKDEIFSIDPQITIDPDKEYQITYWDYPLFIGQEGKYKDFLEEIITEFNKLYPNIKVNYKLLSFVKGKDKLKESLTMGNPPDIYNDIFSNGLINKELQIPLNTFLIEPKDKKEEQSQELDNYNRLAIATYSCDQKIWGLPNWLIPEVWVGNKKLLSQAKLNLDKVKSQGWTWDEFYQTTLRIKDLNRKSSIIFNPYNSRLFYQILATSNHPQLISKTKEKEEEKLILSNSIRDIFERLDKLRSNKVFPKSTSTMNKKFLPYFWRGETSIIAPVNMWLLNNLYQRDDNKKNNNIDLTLLPIPSNNPNQSKNPIKVAGLLLFRQEDYQGDDHTKAVYQFAKFINQEKMLLLAKKLNVIPAYLPLERSWQQQVRLQERIKEQLLTYIKQGRPNQIISYDYLELKNELKKVMDEKYKLFWLKDISSSEVIEKIKTETQSLINNQTKEKSD